MSVVNLISVSQEDKPLVNNEKLNFKKDGDGSTPKCTM